MTILDPHGQPLPLHLNASRRLIRDVSELLGLAKGIICDGQLRDEEVRYLYAWGPNHPDVLARWPVNLIYARLMQILADGRVDEDERADLHEILSALVGGTASINLGYEGASALPLDTPPPLVCCGPDEVFVFTGRFAYGTRKNCEAEVCKRGSRCESNVTRRTTFLVIGTFGSEDWAHSSFGRKIQRGVELRSSGFPIRIVGEDHWANSLTRQ